jgi:hypothetical protein
VKEPTTKRTKFNVDLLSYMDNTRPVTRQRIKTPKEYLDIRLARIKTYSNQQDIITSNFYKEHDHNFVPLSHFARSVLCVPATSAPVERIFSVGGYILQSRRRRMTDRLFRQMIFLKCNFKLLKSKN